MINIGSDNGCSIASLIPNTNQVWNRLETAPATAPAGLHSTTDRPAHNPSVNPALIARLTDSIPVPHLTTALDARVIVGADGFIRCCSWCCSAETLAAINRTHPRQVSHSLCGNCRQIMEGQVA